MFVIIRKELPQHTNVVRVVSSSNGQLVRVSWPFARQSLLSMAGILRSPAHSSLGGSEIFRGAKDTHPCHSQVTVSLALPAIHMSRRLLICGAGSRNAVEIKPVLESSSMVTVPSHPLIKHWVSVLRDVQTPCHIFRNAMGELGRLLIYEASKDWLPTIRGVVQSPMDAATVEFIDPKIPIVIVPILRAGLALAEHAPSIFPATRIYHLGISRDEETLKPSVYLNKLPNKLPKTCCVLIVDPMLATGGTVVAALDLVKERGVSNHQIKLVSAVAAYPALQKLNEKYPGLQVCAGCIDPRVDDKGFIIPGLGDAGDRSFGT